MKGVIRRRARARPDFIEIFQRYARDAGFGVARVLHGARDIPSILTDEFAMNGE